jgi:putative tricarboxylic transport membrane protein
MRAAEFATALVLMGMGGVVLYDAARLGIGWGHEGPRSGFVPFWLGLLLVVLTGVIAIRSWRSTPTRPFITRAQSRPVLVVLAPAVGLVLLTEAAGLYLAAAVYLSLYMRLVGRHSWLLVAAIATALPVVTYVVFERWFLVPLPKGPVEAWLGL